MIRISPCGLGDAQALAQRGAGDAAEPAVVIAGIVVYGSGVAVGADGAVAGVPVGCRRRRLRAGFRDEFARSEG